MEKFLTDLFENQKYNPDNFFLMAGPCVVEGRDLVNEVAEKVSETAPAEVLLPALVMRLH